MIFMQKWLRYFSVMNDVKRSLMEGKNDDEQSAPDEENPEENPETFPEFCRSKPLARCPVASTDKRHFRQHFSDRRIEPIPVCFCSEQAILRICDYVFWRCRTNGCDNSQLFAFLFNLIYVSRCCCAPLLVYSAGNPDCRSRRRGEGREARIE